MKNKTAFILSVALTAFLLFLAGGVVSTVRGKGLQSAAVIPDGGQETVLEAAPGDALGPAVGQALADRDAVYQQTIAEANARLEQAQQEQQKLRAELAAAQSQVSPAVQSTELPVAAQSMLISPQEAAQVAANYLGDTEVYSVETTLNHGETVYQVTMSSGKIAFVSLTGEVLRVRNAPGTSFSAGNSQGGDSDDGDDDREDHEDHEDHEEHNDHEEHDDD